MAEYLHPGVYTEETSFRAKSIEGVATSTAGFVGLAAYGPTAGDPVLVTSTDAFVRRFGALQDLVIGAAPRTNYLAHAVNLFFENGGRRLYIARVYVPPAGGTGIARGADVAAGASTAFWQARFPGLAGNLRVRTRGVRSGNLLRGAGAGATAAGLRPGDMVEAQAGAARSRTVGVPGGAHPATVDALAVGDLYFAYFDDTGALTLRNAADTLDLAAAGIATVQKVTLSVLVERADGTLLESHQGLSPHPLSETFIGQVLRHEDPAAGIDAPVDADARIHLSIDTVPAETPPGDAARITFASGLASSLLSDPAHDVTMTDGSDGQAFTANALAGSGVDDTATGLVAMEAAPVALVAAPSLAELSGDQAQLGRDAIIGHCERMRYRFALVSAERTRDEPTMLEARGQHDTSYGAMFFPWLIARNPNRSIGPGRDTIQLPPEGAVAGVYARSDIERGVHKAPANETVRGIVRFSRNVNERQQDTLNPEGVNCLRSFEGRGHRVWGARTMSSDPEWTYVNVRRLFIFLRASIDQGTRWVVFEPNNEELWLKVRMTIESFLYDVWRTGALLGTRPEEAYFVRCDRSTMSQGDLDNGRLVCLIGVAPTKPAEFVIFRIGQWTAEASIL